MGATTVTLRWDEPLCPFQNGPIAAHVIEYAPDNGTLMNALLQESSEVTGLTACTNYTLRIAAVNYVGISDFSSPLSVLTGSNRKARILFCKPCV